ncbi:MAG TPA: PEP-CTERM sorting domain-containing protein [Rhodopila sp.]
MAFGFGLCSSAHALGIMDALSTAPDAAHALNVNSAAESFVADSRGIGDVELNLSETSTLTNGSVAITLRADNSNTPGASIDTIQQLNESQIPTTQTLFDFYNLPINNLVPGTKYWIEVAKPTGSSVSTDSYSTLASNVITGNAATTSNPGDTAYAVGTGSGTISRLMTLCVSDDNSCDAANPVALADAFNETAVPEPAGIAVLAAGLAGLAFVRWRRPIL